MFKDSYKFEESFLKKINLSEIRDSKIIVGLSGGADSVFLLSFLNKEKINLNLNIIAAHLNHEWRESAIVDEEFSIALCEQLKIPIIVKKASDLNFTPKERGSKEDTARQLRRYFFESLAKENDAKFILLAHHLDDQEENFFIRIIRGSSISGLAGIKRLDGIYFRPLLEISKKEILDVLHENHISYINDPTNEHTDYLRNNIRKNVIPSLKEIDSRFDKNFLKTITKIQDANNFIDKITTETLLDITTEKGLDIKKFLMDDPFIQDQVIVKWLIQNKASFTPSDNFIKEVKKFLSSKEGGSHTFDKWKIIKEKNNAIIDNQVL